MFLCFQITANTSYRIVWIPNPFCFIKLFQITGQYSVLLPDGRVQTVTYSVRPETGFVVSSTFNFQMESQPDNICVLFRLR